MNIITENPKTSFNLSKAASDRIKVLLKDELLNNIRKTEVMIVMPRYTHSLTTFIF